MPLTSSRPETWDRVAATYDQERAHDHVYTECIDATVTAVNRRTPAAAVPSGRIDRLLDVGCGTGMVTERLRRPDREIVAVDHSPASLAVLRRKCPEISKQVADILALPFMDASFDTVLCANTLQHLTPDLHPRAVRELQRVLRADGRLILTVHHFSKEKRAKGWKKEGKPGQPGIDYIFRFTRSELQALLPGATIRSIGGIRWWQKREMDHGHMLLAECQQG